MSVLGGKRVRLKNSLVISNTLTGHSDGNIRYFEYQNDKFEYLSEYKSSDPQRGIAFLPKRGVNTHENEVARAFKTVSDSYVEPISFIVPRRSEVFQDDIYPPVVGGKPAMSSSEWFEGKTALPPKVDFASIYAGEGPAEVPSDYKPPAPVEAKPPSLTKKEAEAKPETSTESTVPASTLKGPPSSMKEQTASIKDLASKYDDDDEPEADDSSSFEEVSKPADRSTHQSSAVAPAPGTSDLAPLSRSLGDPLSAVKAKPDDFDQASQAAAAQSTEQQIQNQQGALASSKAEPLKEQLPSPSPVASSPATADTSGAKGQTGNDNRELKQSLAEIKSLLEEQRRTMSAQNDTIGRLTAEVDRLRSRIGES